MPTLSSVRALHCTGTYRTFMGPKRSRKSPKEPATDAAVPISNFFALLGELPVVSRCTSPSLVPSCLQAPDQAAEHLSSAHPTSMQLLQCSEMASSSSPASSIDADLQHPVVTGEPRDLPVSDCHSGADGVGRHPFPPCLLRGCHCLTTRRLPQPAHSKVP